MLGEFSIHGLLMSELGPRGVALLLELLHVVVQFGIVGSEGFDLGAEGGDCFRLQFRRTEGAALSDVPVPPYVSLETVLPAHGAKLVGRGVRPS